LSAICFHVELEQFLACFHVSDSWAFLFMLMLSLQQIKRKIQIQLTQYNTTDLDITAILSKPSTLPLRS